MVAKLSIFPEISNILLLKVTRIPIISYLRGLILN